MRYCPRIRKKITKKIIKNFSSINLGLKANPSEGSGDQKNRLNQEVLVLSSTFSVIVDFTEISRVLIPQVQKLAQEGRSIIDLKKDD